MKTNAIHPRFPGITGLRRLSMLAAGLTGSLLLASSALAADVITSTTTVTPADKQFSGAEWRAISLAANRVLMHVDGAVNALADKKSDLATTNINQGLTLVKILDGVLPTTTVKTQINGGGLNYSTTDTIKAAFVPIYREYDSVDVLSPVAAQKQTKPAVKTAPAKGPSAGSADIAYEGVDYSSIRLDLRLARRDLQAAQDFLKAGDSDAAKVTLQDIQANGAVFEYSSMRLPLVRAMDNLRLAESEMNSKRPDQARAALGAANDALKNYEAIAGNTHSKEVKELEQQLTDESKRLTQHTPESFSAKISAWWSTIREWI